MTHVDMPGKPTVVHVVGTMRDGGAEQLIRTLVPRIVAASDFDLHFLSIYDSRLDDNERANLGVPLHEVGRRSRADLSFAPRLVAKIRQLRPLIVHAHSHSGKFAGRLAAIMAGVPKIVFTEHGDDARGLVHWSVNRILNARTARFIVFTESERRRYATEQGIPLARVIVIPNGILTPAAIDVHGTRLEMGLHEGDIAIATPARLVHQKNQALLLRAVAALRAEGRHHVRLFIMGEGPDAAALEAVARELQIVDAIRFMGFRRDAQRLTAACDMLALSSLWEKMPLVIGEAMLSGVPVVSTPWVGVERFILDGQTGYLSADWSVGAFRSALARAIDNVEARGALAARAKEAAADRYDLDRSVQSHVQLYQTLLAETESRK